MKTQAFRTDQNSAANAHPRASLSTTRALLIAGLIAGPLYVVTGLLQAFTRDGFDLRRHALSLLSNGDLGWIQVANFVVSGLLVVAAAVGMRRALPGGRGATWGPLLLGLYGLGLVGAGLFRADPALGFPIGTPQDVNTVTTSGLLHFVFGGIGFLGLITASLVFARRFAGLRQWGWAVYSAATGVIFFAAFAGIASGVQPNAAAQAFVNLAFGGAVVLGWAWISAMAARLWNGLEA